MEENQVDLEKSFAADSHPEVIVYRTGLDRIVYLECSSELRHEASRCQRSDRVIYLYVAKPVLWLLGISASTFRRTPGEVFYEFPEL